MGIIPDREHFRVHLGTDEDRLFVSKPVLGRVSGRWTIQVTRPLRDAAGRFGGVLVMSMDTEYLARFYEAVRQQDSMIRLVGDDGIVRAAAPAPAGTLGAAIPPALLPAEAALDEAAERVARVSSSAPTATGSSA